MNSSGIMEEIRSLLREGKSSTETIALGYKSSTVYKAQRQLARSTSNLSPPVTTQVLVTNMASEDSTRLRNENQALQEQILSLAEVTAERDSLREELDSALSQIEELTLEARQAQIWQNRFAEVEPAVEEAAVLRREINDLHRHLSYSRDVMDQHSQQWQADLKQEQEARREAEDRVTRRGSEIDQLKADKQGLAQQLEAIPGYVSKKFSQLIQPLNEEVEELRQLKVWVGHPCAKCGKPTTGVTTRKLAAELLRDGGYGHGDCVKKSSWW